MTEDVALNADLVQDVLRESAIRFFVDDEGDIGSIWDNCHIYFFLHGEHGEILQLRVYLPRHFDIGDKAMLLDLLDEWNRTKMFPKAYTVTADDGQVTVTAEHTFDFEPGVPRELLRFTINGWVSTLLRFVEWFGDRT